MPTYVLRFHELGVGEVERRFEELDDNTAWSRRVDAESATQSERYHALKERPNFELLRVVEPP